MNTVSLSSKEIVKDLLLRLPDEISLHQIAQEIEFIAAVRQGIAELDRGENITIEQIEKEWMNEIQKRCREIDEGKVQLIPAEDALAQLRKNMHETRLSSQGNRILKFSF